MRKIEALEKMVASQAVGLSKKSELAYEKVQDIANRAVTAARRESYSAPLHHSATVSREDSQS